MVGRLVGSLVIVRRTSLVNNFESYNTDVRLVAGISKIVPRTIGEIDIDCCDYEHRKFTHSMIAVNATAVNNARSKPRCV